MHERSIMERTSGRMSAVERIVVRVGVWWGAFTWPNGWIAIEEAPTPRTRVPTKRQGFRIEDSQLMPWLPEEPFVDSHQPRGEVKGVRQAGRFQWSHL